MYPKVFTDFAFASDTYGPVSVLPTPAYFYGLADGEELFADIEKGKTLVIVNQAMSGTDSQGMVTVFFELNGQPRNARIPDRSRGGATLARPKADPDNAGHVAAPMPGKIGVVGVSNGQAVSKGDKLLSIEAMKMETAVYAPIAGRIKEVHVRTGSSVESRDLLVTIEPPAK